MFNYLAIILISVHCYLLVKCPLARARQLKHPEICVDNQIQTYAINHLKLCYSNYLEDRLTFVWFSVGESLNDTFDLYRFTFRVQESQHSSRSTIKLLTNLTELIDATNTLRMYNLDSGDYEVCIEFHSKAPLFIYQPRDGCIVITVGGSTSKTFAHDSTPLLIALASGIVIFFVLGLVAQWAKDRRRKRMPIEKHQPRPLSSRILSKKALKQQRDRLVKNVFQKHLDEPQSSQIRQWARDQAFRHRISTHELDFDRSNFIQKWNRQLVASIESSRRVASSEAIVSSDRPPTISEEICPPRTSNKVTFDLASLDDCDSPTRF